MKLLIRSLAVVLFTATSNVVLAQIEPPSGLEVSARVTSSGIVSVVLCNYSKASINVWNQYNSWGASHWRLFIVRNGKVSVYFQNPNRLFTKNSPSFVELSKGDCVKIKLDVNDGAWSGLDDKKVSFSAVDKVLVSYDVPTSKEGYSLKVWYGVIAAVAEFVGD